MAKYSLVLCGYCGKTFEPPVKNRSAIFCSMACYSKLRAEKAKTPSRKCEFCAKEFTIRKGRESRNKFCSPRCYFDHRRSLNSECLNCGKLYHAHPYMQKAHNKGKFCSRDCHSEWYKKTNSNCSECGKSYRTTISRNQRFCSKKCWLITLSRKMSGEKNRAWIDGRSMFHPSWRGSDWPKISESARKRAGYKCEHCGISQEEHLKKGLGKLSVNHKIRFHNHLDIKKANHKSNLEALCKSCHPKADSKAPSQMTLFLNEKSDGNFFRPGYACGERVSTAKLTRKEVILLRKLRLEGWTFLKLADRFGIRHSTVQDICSGKTWKHLPILGKPEKRGEVA